MPDRRQHRGPHPADAELFAASRWAALRSAVGDLSWLLGRGYSEKAGMTLVGDRYALSARQRIAVARAACSDAAVAGRSARRLEPSAGALAGRGLAIDGFNCLITVEAALSGGLVLVGRDRAHRDLASVHGSYRRVEETAEAVRLIGGILAGARVASTLWLLDQPVSNSGRLKGLLLSLAEQNGWSWEVELVPSPDRILATTDRVAASSDSGVLDQAAAWVDLPGAVIARHLPKAWLLDLGTAAPGGQADG